ncbi:MADS-box transcription factor 32 [Acorus calamus]|uniref:MADS-box transcription factor 32 n=1 Tax=Acorus calamus TaxID=4465 RepID=A0AAV9FF02_ACOCL|nr:MADS-box transcription factor 32 [Acorus calamus]
MDSSRRPRSSPYFVMLSAKEIIEKHMMITSKSKFIQDNDMERRAEIERVERLCYLLESDLRFRRVEGNKQRYTLPVLDVLERDIEASIKAVRMEKDRKIQGEIDHLDNMVRHLKQEAQIMYNENQRRAYMDTLD